jgi:RHS repeat-associated protein
LTQVTDYPGLGAPNRVTDYWYDWRDRLVATKSGVQSSENDGVNRPIIVTTYDNLDEAIETQQYAGDGVTPQIVNGVLQALDPSLLRAQEIDSYDNQGRLYQTQVYDVNPSTGAVSTSALTTNDYYDHRGDLIAESDPGGLWTKSLYDGAGRDIMDYTTDGAGGASWTAASSVANDTVLEQVQTVYDADSNVIETIDSQRFHNATGTGPLGTPTSGIGARVYYAANYYDNADRLIASVDAGTNGGTAWTRPSTVPASSPTLLVTTYAYNAMGLVQDVTDPMGIVNRTYYDNLGRTIKTIQDYTGGTPGNENDITTEYGYDGNNNTIYVRADEPGGSYQQTNYVYGVTTASGSGVNSNDILSAVQHPDLTTGQPSASQQDSYLVNALGQVTQYTDRNGNVHQYSYDVLGRLTSDAVTTLGAGVDGSIRRIEYGYDGQGNLSLITSYNAASGGTVVNQVERIFNGLGQLIGEYQSHSGAVVQGSTPEVQYAYNEMSNGENNSRLVSMTYPSGYTLNNNYNSGLDDSISRLSSISDSSGILESYKYLGLDTVVERDHPQINVNETYISQNGQTGDAGDQYVGLDRFGRVVDQNWYNTTTQTSTDNFAYGYNQDGDVLYKQNLVDAVMSELYQYDNLHQLISFARGTLNSTDTAIVGTASATQSWSPDALGNFNSVTTNGTTQTRTANQQNEITSISGAGTVTYDANGNITADGSGNTYVYDAWNRLVAVKNGGTILAAYGYNGLGERVNETHGSTTTDLYYSANWQVLEEHVNGQLQARYVWSPAGVDTLVLRDDSSQNNGILDRRLYVQQDALGNVTALLDTSGNVVERYAYAPYGAVTVLNPDFSVRGTSAYNWNYFFQSKRYDGAVGLYDSRGRAYSPTLMRPLQADPLGLGPDRNDYRWEGNNPTDAIDPSGETSWGTKGSRWEWSGLVDMPWAIGQKNDYFVGTGVSIAYTQWKGMIDPIGHDFFIVDGVGYGFFQVHNYPFGEGRVRFSDLQTYPLKQTEEEINALSRYDWYSLLHGEIYVDSRFVDPVLFKKAVLKLVNKRACNPPTYNLFTYHCSDFVRDIIHTAMLAAYNKGAYNDELITDGKGHFLIRSQEALSLAAEIRGMPVNGFSVDPPLPPPGWTLGDICGNLPEAAYVPPSLPNQYIITGYNEVPDLEGGWSFEPIVEKRPPVTSDNPWDGVEP